MSSDPRLSPRLEAIGVGVSRSARADGYTGKRSRQPAAHSANERWLDQAGAALCERRLALGESMLAPRDRLIEILWLVSRSIRVTGDLAAARAHDPSFLTCARMIATNLGLPHVMAGFSGSEAGLERQFFDLFDAMCDELRHLALPDRGAGLPSEHR